MLLKPIIIIVTLLAGFVCAYPQARAQDNSVEINLEALEGYVPPPMFAAPPPKAAPAPGRKPPAVPVEKVESQSLEIRKLTREEMLERNNSIIGSGAAQASGVKTGKASKSASISPLPTQKSSGPVPTELDDGNVIPQTAEDILKQIDKNYKGQREDTAEQVVVTAEPPAEKNREKAAFSTHGQFEIALPYAPGVSILSPEHRKILNEQILIRLQKFNTSRMEIKSYATALDSTESHARRISLERALRIRDFLTEKGIAAERVDVRALGPAPDPALEDQVELVIYQH